MRSNFRPVHLEIEKERLSKVLKEAEEKLVEEERRYAAYQKRERSFWRRWLMRISRLLF